MFGLILIILIIFVLLILLKPKFLKRVFRPKANSLPASTYREETGKEGAVAEPRKGNLQLVFQSGYENSVGSPPEAHQDIAGADKSFSEKNDWKADLESHPNVNNFFIYYEGGTPAERYAKIIPDPKDPANSVLHFWLQDAYIPYGKNKYKGRIQATLGVNGIKEMLIKHRLSLHPDMAALAKTTETFNWLTVQEFWNDEVKSDYPFRISINIVKPTSSPGLTFATHGQTKRPNEEAWDDVWTAVGTDFTIPVNEWMTVETYFKEGNKSTGKFTLTITDTSGRKHTVVDVTDFTYHPDDPTPDGLDNVNIMKLYAPERLINPMKQSGKTLQLYWDDFELWL